jgi:superfamily I DNA/RNA helicase
MAIVDDSVFITAGEDKSQELLEKASAASAICNDDRIEEKAKATVQKAARQKEQITKGISRISTLVREIEELKDSHSINAAEAEEAYKELDVVCQQIKAENQATAKEIDLVTQHVDDILSEHDFIKKLLAGKGGATAAQLEVLAFPKTAKATTNVLQIAGGAGTGKTLCLLAKMIKGIDDDVRSHQSVDLFGEDIRKKGIFVCFNKQLAGYVRSLMKGFPQVSPHIEVVSLDLYINQLVKYEPSDGFQYLADFAKDVRYPAGFKISYDRDYFQQAMDIVAQGLPDKGAAIQSVKGYLDTLDYENVQWMMEEIRWLEARYLTLKEAKEKYPSAPRVGRGTSRLPNKEIRSYILKVWEAYQKQLADANLYSIEMATKRLMGSKQLPKYDFIAIDEAQDFTVLSIKLLLKFRKNQKSHVYISGDEWQKIYQRDFTWKELDADVQGRTITLKENMRNSDSIKFFAARLVGEKTVPKESMNGVWVKKLSRDRIVEGLHNLERKAPGETRALIGDEKKWRTIISQAGLKILNSKGDISKPGLYLFSEFTNKGLEFDSVIIADAGDRGREASEEKALRYVHFTRARKRLFVFYSDTPSKLLQEYYADFLAPNKEKA